VETTGLDTVNDEVIDWRWCHSSTVRKAVDAFVANASLIIAHNANFDRKFAERISAVFEQMAWACTMS
jgi:DNA polymerase III epsilon subunit-like protein